MGFFKKTWKMAGYIWRVSKSPRSDYLSALLLCHALEKGMGSRNVKRGFGKEKCERLIAELASLEARGKADSYGYKEALSVLAAYLAFQESEGVDVSELRHTAMPLIERGCTDYQAGFRVVKRDELLIGSRIDFPAFVNSRHSMRLSSAERIDESELVRAIDIAKRAPSACNREPWRVHYSLDRKECALISDALPKQAFLSDVPYYCVVTVDRSLFNRAEVFQWFINGGIFLSYFTLALHYLGIGSIILEYNLFSESGQDLRSFARIPDQEEIVAIVGFGKYPEEAKCIYADRMPAEEIAIRI